LCLICVLCGFCSVSSGFAAAQAPMVQLRGQVVDEDAQPITRVEITGKDAEGKVATYYTDPVGRFEIDFPEARTVLLSFSKPGYSRVDARQFDLVPGVNEIAITLNHETELQQSIEVHSASTQIDPETTSRQETLVQREILNTPVP